MSADNGIYILITTDRLKRRQVSPGNKSVVFDYIEGGIKTFRVAEVRGIDDIYYLRNEERHNLGAYMYEYWGKAPVFYEESEALLKARDLADRFSENCWPLEYGINVLDFSEFNFYCH